MSVLEEIKSALTSEPEDKLAHYGMPRRSGRYPWGSGEDPYQHSVDFYSRLDELKKKGWTETPANIMKEFGLTSTEYRNEKSLCKDVRRMYKVAQAKSLKKDGKTDSEIGRIMGVNESTVRGWFNKEAESRMMQAMNTADFLIKRSKELSANGGMIDVGAGVERELGISATKMKEALYILENQGYEVRKCNVRQAGNNYTRNYILCPPGTEYKDVYNFDKIGTVKEYITQDGGITFGKKFTYPASLDSKRLKVYLGDETTHTGEKGVDRDGLIEIRRGVPDLSLGNDKYAQVRILVDGDRYLKGMAVYSDNLPDGVDIVFNSNKKSINEALKKIKNDPDNPFGSAIKDADQGGQYWYDPKTGERVPAGTPDAKLGLINKRASEGDWGDWKDKLPSQFLSKQSKQLAEKQLNLAKADKQAEFNDIMEVNNPTIKKQLLADFADNCDSAAVHLQAAALPGQKYHVMIPINTLKDNEVYAPGYEDGTKLALVRYPHGGIFEIPILTVNNKHKAAKDVIGKDSIDAVGVNKTVASQLSGADFDGDTVMCIPTHNGKVKIINRQPFDELKNFDTMAYQYDDKRVDADGNEHYYREGREFKVLSKQYQQKQMGIITNLISDMTLAAAKDDEIIRAVKHSMVIIDAEKHKLDYRQSAMDNNVAALHKEYQGKSNGGASTVISKAKSKAVVNKRQGSPRLNIKGKDWYDPSKPEGSLIWFDSDDLYHPDNKYNKATGIMTVKTTTPRQSVKYNVKDPTERDYYEPRKHKDPDTGEVTFTNKDGTITYKSKAKTQDSTKMAETEDAYTLVSEARHPMEILYADYANSMKNLARQARIEAANTGKIAYNKNAKALYLDEVKSLEEKVNNAELNRPRERAALRLANAAVAKKIADNPDMTKDEISKARTQAISKYRQEVGTVSRKDRNIRLTDREWEAIQAGAISETQLKRIIANADMDDLRARATPHTTTTLTTAKINKINRMKANDYTIAEIAAAIGVSTSTVSSYLK